MDERRIVGLDATAERVAHASARRAGNYSAALLRPKRIWQVSLET